MDTRNEEWLDIIPGYRSKRITTPDGVTVTLHRPILSEKEKAKRERVVEAALAHFGKKQNYIEQGVTQ